MIGSRSSTGLDDRKPPRRDQSPRHVGRRRGKQAAVVALLLIVTCGCRQRTAPLPPPGAIASPEQSSREHLIKAVDLLNRFDEFEQTQATVQAAYHLNRWIESQTPPVGWTADPLIARLPRDIREDEALKDLPALQFQLEDIKAIQEAVWMREVSQWASRRSPDDHFARHLEETTTELSLRDHQVEQLVVAQRLFDWTIRNIQLDALLPYPSDPVAGPTTTPDEPLQAQVPAPRRAIPGPGYRFQPWQTLLYGHGDAWQRARVFTQLARQQRIDVVMLAFPGRTTPPRPRPWLPAVLIDDQLYLFDSRLGLPIPGPNGRGVATLAQVVKEPGLLASLDLDDDHRYGVAQSELDTVIALIDAPLLSLSQRMKLVETHLTGQQRTVFTTSPSGLAQRLQQCTGISEVTIWSLPYETAWYQTALAQKISQDQKAYADYFLEVGVFSVRNTVVQGRYCHFRGEFEKSGERKGAKTLYMESRIPQEHVDRIETSEEVQKQFGLERPPVGSAREEIAWQNKLKAFKVMITQAKQHASYWLGLAHYETGKYEAAIQWLERRTLEATPEGRWVQGARYNLGRTYEAMGQLEHSDEARRLEYLEKARQLYRADDSPQRHGNLLRARQLERQTSGSAPSP